MSQSLKSIRETVLNLSQFGLAAELGLHAQTISDWERGKKLVAHPRMLELAGRDFARTAAVSSVPEIGAFEV